MFDSLGIHPSRIPAGNICINAICSDLDESDEEMWQWIPPGGTTLIYLSRLKLFSQQMGNWKVSTRSIIFDKIFEIHWLWFQKFILLSLTLYPIFFVFTLTYFCCFKKQHVHFSFIGENKTILNKSAFMQSERSISLLNLFHQKSPKWIYQSPPTLLNSPRMVVITLQKTPLIYSWCVGAGIWRWGDFI